MPRVEVLSRGKGLGQKKKVKKVLSKNTSLTKKKKSFARRERFSQEKRPCGEAKV